MNYKLNLGAWNSVFAVPASVVDNYIRIASGDNLKILLYLLRNAGGELSGEVLSSALGLSEDSVEDGLSFWKQRGIIDACDGDYVPSGRTLSTPATERKTDIIRRTELTRTPDFVPKEIAKTVRGSSEADYLFKRCEELFGRNLKHTEQNTLMLILEDACMPVGVTLLLVEYCFSVGKATPAYMRTLAADWMDKDIKTIEKAEEYIAELRSFSTAEARFKKMFSVNSAFSKQQRDFINTWVNAYGFSDDMISKAYDLTLDATGKLAFPYMNKILAGWHDKRITAPEQLEQKKSDNSAKNESSFNISEIEKLVSQKYTKQER